MNKPINFSFSDRPNEFSFSNISLLKLYDSLSVIDYSLRLIEQYGRKEFEAVIMQQLRIIFTKSNHRYNNPKKNNSGEENSFSLFDILGDYDLFQENEVLGKVSDIKLFPEIKIAYRDYNDRINSESKYFHFTDKSIVQSNKFTVEEFLKQDYVKVTDANGNEKFKSVEQCIKILANKLQGAHYQVYIKKIELDVILNSEVISHTLGTVTVRALLPLVQNILLQDDQKQGLNSYSHYMNKNEYVSFEIYSATPIFHNEKNH